MEKPSKWERLTDPVVTTLAIGLGCVATIACADRLTDSAQTLSESLPFAGGTLAGIALFGAGVAGAVHRLTRHSSGQ